MAQRCNDCLGPFHGNEQPCYCACVKCDAHRFEARFRAQRNAHIKREAKPAIPVNPFEQLAALMENPVETEFGLPTPEVCRNRPRLGGGAFGVAIALSRTLCLKITADPYEYGIACKLKGHKTTYTWRIYATGKVPKDREADYVRALNMGRSNLFYIIGERLQETRYSKPRGFRDALSKRCNKELEKFGVQHHDTHNGNLLRRGRTLVFVDVREVKTEHLLDAGLNNDGFPKE